jgi:hypothetical protein
VVKETPFLPRKLLAAPERHLCPQAMQKGYKNPLSTLTHGTVFQVPLHSPLCGLSLLFSTNKIFPTSATGVCLCFHSQSGLKNPEHLKFPCMSSVHQALVILSIILITFHVEVCMTQAFYRASKGPKQQLVWVKI